MIPIVFAIIMENATNPHQVLSQYLPPVDLTFGIGDIVGAVALLVSAFTFYIAHTQGSQSEQMKISREILAGIAEKNRPIEEIIKKQNVTKDHPQYDVPLDLISPLIFDIDYFAYLILSGEIKDKVVLGYYKDMLSRIIEHLLIFVISDEQKIDLYRNYPNFNEIRIRWKLKTFDTFKAIFDDDFGIGQKHSKDQP
jgi:hypothetical protein